MCPILSPQSRLITSRREGAKAMMRWPETSHSSCMPMASAGFGCRSVWPTVRCRRTTSRSSRRYGIRCIHERNRIRLLRTKDARGNEYATSPDARFPYVLTTYRLTEHHTAGGMSRTLSHLAELQPELFCEISVELAARTSIIQPGEWVTVVTARGAIEAHALVTPRMQTLDDRRKIDSPSRAAISLGIFRPGEGRHRQRSDRHFRRAERAHHGNERPSLQCIARDGARPTEETRRQREIRARTNRCMTTNRISYRRDAVHRLQGLRSGLQGME